MAYKESELNLYKNKFLMSFNHAGKSFVVVAILSEADVTQILLSEVITYNGDLTYSEDKSTFAAVTASDIKLSPAQLFTTKLEPKFNKWLADNYGAGAPVSFLDALVIFFQNSVQFTNGKLSLK